MSSADELNFDYQRATMDFVHPGSIRGYDVYCSIWEVELDEVLSTCPERGSVHDQFSVAVIERKD